MAVLVAPGDLHRLGDHANIFGLIMTERRQIEALKNTQHLGNDDPAPRRWWRGDHPAAIGNLKRRSSPDAKCREIRKRQQAVMGAHVVCDAPRDLSLIE